MQILYFAQLWPRLSYSSAHVRTLGIVERLLMQEHNITFITPQQVVKGEEIAEYNQVRLCQGDPGNVGQMSNLLKKIKSPHIAFFDTFVSEEKYSHYIHHLFPNCMLVLDLQDYQSLRLMREKVVQEEEVQQLIVDYINNYIYIQHQDVLSSIPNINTPLFDREMASIIRSDLVLTSSDYELILLNQAIKGQNKTELLTFFYPTADPQEDIEKEQLAMQKDYNRRRNFVFIGNMNQKPNADAVQYLMNLWPQIRSRIPDAELHIYGTNMPKENTSIEGVKRMGVMSSLMQLSKYRVQLAPMRFGAGIKGKITDGWYNYLPVVTTPIGAEGLFMESQRSLNYLAIDKFKGSRFYSDMKEDNLDQQTFLLGDDMEQASTHYYEYNNRNTILTFGGYYDNYSDEDFIQSSVKLYSDQAIWEEKSMIGFDILKKRMDKDINDRILNKILSNKLTNLAQDRSDLLRKITWIETLKSNHHFAKFINEKRKHQEVKRSIDKK